MSNRLEKLLKGLTEEVYSHFVRDMMPTIAGLNIKRVDNPITEFGNSVYSQGDEDGILFEILRRLGITSGVFAELGVGDGTENNTLSLLAAGWKGFWLGGEDLKYDFNPDAAPRLNFSFNKAWITKDNVVNWIRTGLSSIRVPSPTTASPHVISIDLDGNDWHIVKEILEADIRPSVFVVEYNGRFVPPTKFVMPYDENHSWGQDDYFGASLDSYCELFDAYDYNLVACSNTGINAFFARKGYSDGTFPDLGIWEMYVPPRYFLAGLHDAWRHPRSMKTIEYLMRRANNGK